MDLFFKCQPIILTLKVLTFYRYFLFPIVSAIECGFNLHQHAYSVYNIQIKFVIIERVKSPIFTRYDTLLYANMNLESLSLKSQFQRFKPKVCNSVYSTEYRLTYQCALNSINFVGGCHYIALPLSILWRCGAVVNK